MATEDQQLVSILLHQADDSTAWNRIDQLYRRRLTCYARTFFNHANDCENIVQEALTGLFNSFRNKKFDENRSLQAYLYAITHNLAISQIRKNSRGIRADGEADNNIEQSGPGVSSLYRSEEDRLHREVVIVAALREYISSLKKALKFETIKILELVWVRGMGNNEAADMLGIDPQVVANTKFQGRKALVDIVKNTPTITHPDLITPPAFHETPQSDENPVYSREYIHAYIDGALSQEEADAFTLMAYGDSESRGKIRTVQTEFDYHNHTV
ncbi:MAG: RNA polymerase sigma factor, partial [Gemmataceae bacterium]